MVLSPDPKREDTQGDLSMRELTMKTITALQKRLNIPVRFIAALHDDHTDIRHVHIIALVNRSLTLRDFQAMRMAAEGRRTPERGRGVAITGEPETPLS
jgi:hypothetical protein